MPQGNKFCNSWMLCNKQVRTTLTVLFIQFNSADAPLQLGHATAEKSKIYQWVQKNCGSAGIRTNLQSKVDISF